MLRGTNWNVNCLVYMRAEYKELNYILKGIVGSFGVSLFIDL